MVTGADKFWQQVAIPDRPQDLNLTYIAGPMTSVGPPDWNYPAFIRAAEDLRNKGRRVISPHELHQASSSITWDWYLRRDITQLVKCNRICLLPGWEMSRGARLEKHIAEELGMEIVEL